MDNYPLIAQIAEVLKEENTSLITAIIEVIGVERTKEFLQKALDIEAAGGMLTKDGARRRTPGGLFFHLVRGGLLRPERERLWPEDYAQPPPARRTTRVAPAPPLSWADALKLIPEATQSVGEAKNVKVTLVGRPAKSVRQAEATVLAMKSKTAPSLPKGLPVPPAGSAITWVVFVANRQFDKVRDSLAKDKEDNLVIEGYPIIDPKSGNAVLLATSCKSVATERAGREAQKEAPPKSPNNR
jgi:hypothetical protein